MEIIEAEAELIAEETIMSPQEVEAEEPKEEEKMV